MGKKQHSKDRMYLTTTEWREEWGGYKKKGSVPFKRLPFQCCAIAFTPFEDPVGTEDGTIFDIANIIPYIQKYKKHPVTGEPLAIKDLIQLNFAKNGDAEYQCPVLGKVFTEHTHIVAVKPTGNVYCWEAVEELNVKAKNWKDLLTDEPFTRKDIIHIQDPLNSQGRTLEDFDHVKKELTIDNPEEDAGVIRNTNPQLQSVLSALGTAEAAQAFKAGGGGKRAEAARILAEAKLAAQKKKEEAAAQAQGSKGDKQAAGAAAGAAAAGPAAAGPAGDWRLRAPDKKHEYTIKPGAATWDTDDHITGAGADKKRKAGAAPDADAQPSTSGRPSPQQWWEQHYRVKYQESLQTTGAQSRGFTSTALAPSTKNQRVMKRIDRNPSKKAYLRLHTSLGDINVELHSDIVPRTCENFLALAEMGYYDGTIFHRSIKNFMIQGGDPTGTGRGGESIYGPTFKDELDSRLLHSGRGMLSMANSGPGTNGSQFFITYKSASHLNYKHSVFGRVVGGLDILGLMEKVPVDDEDRPLQEISIKGVTVFSNPFREMADEEERQVEQQLQQQQDEEDKAGRAEVGTWFSNPVASKQPTASGTGVGKYLSQVAAKPAAGAAAGGAAAGAGAAAAAAAAGAGAAAGAAAGSAQRPAKKPKAAAFANFDAW